MEIAAEQKLNAEIVQKAWEDPQFKEELMKNPAATMEKFAGHKLNLAEGQKLVVVDQTDTSTVYFNIPRKVDVDSLELTEEQLETVAGGSTPFCAIGYGFVVGIALWSATHE
ncbi:NHLP leader peptide family RiPP precursor [Hymenobacter rigui]|uniref:NHLP leader peptide family natural product n=1 Tax=Hymenobacter rigui TaxID=334424 RepID=A0A428KMA3_9BACT|nr:NHLP leader peptide family RiPP precursor [Hymenobacter rigui]RSK47566.1 NHLP leader peptide family natural product precursor [Hymenobacter rigui]